MLALVAPRTLYVASASEDRWADPKGEFLAAYHASEAYPFVGGTGLTVDTQPGIDTPVGEGQVYYHLRKGKHDLTDYDWAQFVRVLRALPGE